MSTSPEHPVSPVEGATTPVSASRRAVVGAAWAAPTVTVLSAAPAFATSAPAGTATVTETTGLASSGTGVVYLALDPAPSTVPVVAAAYDAPGTTTTSLTLAGTSGTAAVYRLAFTTTTRPVPITITAVIQIPRYGTTSAPIAMQPAGALDTRFADPLLGGGTVGNYGGLALQPDGKVLVAGAFIRVNLTTRLFLARLNRDGSLDTSFGDPGLDNQGRSVALTPTGSVLVTGRFQTVNSRTTAPTPRQRLALFSPGGVVEAGFASSGLNDVAWGVVVQPDGKVLVAGAFTTAGPSAARRGGLVRFHPNGDIDTDFIDPNLTGPAYALALQPDGKIVVAGNFTTAGSANSVRRGIARFHPDGRLDTGFGDANLNGAALSVLVQPDGRTVVAGSFTTAGAGNSPRAGVARFTADGTLDTSFADPKLVGSAAGCALQDDGRIVVSGRFTAVGEPSAPRGSLARFNADGTLDMTFADPRITSPGGVPGFGADVIVDRDGLIYVTGDFESAGSPTRSRMHLARFYG